MRGRNSGEPAGKAVSALILLHAHFARTNDLQKQLIAGRFFNVIWNNTPSPVTFVGTLL